MRTAANENAPSRQPAPDAGLKVAWVRLEGVLTPRSSLAATAWIAGNGQTIGQRLTGLAHAAALSPARGLLGALDGELTTRLSHAALRGLSEDRIHILAEEYVEDFLVPSVHADGLDLLRSLRRSHDRVILVSESISPVVDALRSTFGSSVDDILCNRLELQHDRATGRLLPPVIGGPATVRALRAHADGLGALLDHGTGVASTGGDALFLAAVGHPLVVNPDPVLRRMATSAGWTIETLAS